MSKLGENIFWYKLLQTRYFWSSAVCNFSTFKVNFLCLILSESFYFFSLKNIILGAHFLSLKFYKNFNFWSTLFSKNEPNYCCLRSLKQFISKNYFLWVYSFIYILIMLGDHPDLPQPWTPYWQSILLYLLSITEGEAGGAWQTPGLQGRKSLSLGQRLANSLMSSKYICLSKHPYITSAIRLGGWFKKWQMVMKIYLSLPIRTTIWR